MKFRYLLLVVFVGFSTFSGCGDGKSDFSDARMNSMAGGEMKSVVPVKGIVKINGEPAAGVNLFLYNADDPARSILSTRTDSNGTYCWATYKTCDGLASGSYLLGFTHIPKPKKNDTGVDELKGKYKDPKKNKIELKVEEGVPQSDVVYDLATK